MRYLSIFLRSVEKIQVSLQFDTITVTSREDQYIWLIICGNKTPTRCNRWYLLQILLHAEHVSDNTMPISGAREYYTDGRCLWYLVIWFSSCRYGVELRVMCPVCRLLQQPANRTHNLQLHIIPTTWKPKHQIPQAATICIILSSSWDGHSIVRNMFSMQ